MMRTAAVAGLAAEIMQAGYDAKELMKPIPAVLNPLEKNRKILLDNGYGISKEGCLVRRVMQKVGSDMAEVEKQVANCVLWVTSETTYDDGVNSHKRFNIAGKKDNKILPEQPVPADQFGSMNWLVKLYGLAVNIEPGQGNRDYMRHAIQLTAQDIESRTVYSHLGWRKIGRDWVYLHAGMSGGIEVDVAEEGLQRYILQPANA